MMTILLTLLFDLLMIVLFIFRMVKADQIIYIISIALQALLFIDLLAIILLQPKRKIRTSHPSDLGTQRTRRSDKSKKHKLLTQVSCIIALLLLAYYTYSVIIQFI